jgi:hypothetical protein
MSRSKSVPATTNETYKISSDLPCPTPRRQRSAKLANTLNVLKPGESFKVPAADKWSLKSKLCASPGVYTCHKDMNTGDITVWKI